MLDIAASNSIVADNINQIIKERNLKQSAIACKAGFTPQEFNAMLKGRRLMRAVDIASILDVLSVDANELFKKGDAGHDRACIFCALYQPVTASTDYRA